MQLLATFTYILPCLKEEPDSFSTSSSNLPSTAFFSASLTVKNSFTNLSRSSTSPALEVSCPFASRLVPHFSLMKFTKSSKSRPPS
nr:hypothetical protein Iba_chr06aCG10000 [Ipomoea batatas]GMD07249.1 hypothetical protein Iba_chr06cCG5360 [Ipomoea batatas]